MQDSSIDSGFQRNRPRFDSFSMRNKEKKEVYISEAAMSQFSNPKNAPTYQNKVVAKSQLNSIDQQASTNQTSTKGNGQVKLNQDQFSEAVSNHNSTIGVSPPNQNNKNGMKRLRLMKTDVYETDPLLETQNSSNQKSLLIDIDNKLNLKSSFMAEHKDPKWSECKIIGSNIQSRSRSSICMHNGYLYVYGGYELTAGPLGDFWKINMKSEQFIWEKVKVRGKVNPGQKSRHSCEVFNNKMYIFGGQHGASLSSSDLWSFDFQKEQWSLVVPLGKTENNPPSVDSHSSVLIGNKMYTMFGYLSEYGSLTNSVYEFNFDTMCWTNKYKHQPNSYLEEKKTTNIPKVRLESAITYIKSQPNMIFAFGGIDSFIRLNDLWTFNLQNNQFTLIQPKSQIIPKIRNGHQIFGTENEIVVLGGIHDITWELDDLCMFDISAQCWTIVDQDSARRREIVNQPSLSPENNKKNSGQPKNFRSRSIKRGQSSVAVSPQRLSLTSPSKKSYLKTNTFTNFDKDMLNEDESKHSGSPCLGSPTKLLEKKRKEFQIQKHHMLQMFEINDKEEDKFRDLSPTSEAMKNSLFVIGNPTQNVKIKSARITDFGKATVSKFLEPLNDSNKVRQGKKPCARDGHRILSIGDDKILLFGGDRHNMSFNDIYQLDLLKLQEKYKHLLNK